jgi:hypothetical protein
MGGRGSLMVRQLVKNAGLHAHFTAADRQVDAALVAELYTEDGVWRLHADGYSGLRP